MKNLAPNSLSVELLHFNHSLYGNIKSLLLIYVIASDLPTLVRKALHNLELSQILIIFSKHFSFLIMSLYHLNSPELELQNMALYNHEV